MQIKKVGGPRFTGRGLRKFDPKPGTFEWYKAHMPDRLNNTARNISNGLGIPMDDYQDEGKTKPGALTMAVNVIRRVESSMQGVIDAGALDLKDKCPSCGFYLKHTDKPFPSWDKKA